jgi:acyl dehydratase
MISTYVDQMTVGQVSVSRTRTITETDIVTFAMFTGDWHPVHTDIEYASKETRFGQRIAHGALVLSVSLGLVEFWPPAMLAFYGIDRLRFVAPTYINDTVHVETEVLAIEFRTDGDAVVTFRFVVRNHRGHDVMVSDLRALVASAPAGGGEDRG